ncbi:hypothetical protein [Nocardia transvalensis]|uniref:hypothetical protein n=1 Tax=Nocardia transvalensis TaxID=37333 RepID=UPI0018950434|nr:hypothetical protein [Nocardia transvalensis]MBF6333009.1 hypothetical protein [Nocardia transvalensis]
MVSTTGLTYDVFVSDPIPMTGMQLPGGNSWQVAHHDRGPVGAAHAQFRSGFE